MCTSPSGSTAIPIGATGSSSSALKACPGRVSREQQRVDPLAGGRYPPAGIRNAPSREGTLMWILRNLVWLLIMIAIVGFAILNVNGRVTEIRLPGAAYVDLPLTVILFAAFVLGMFLAFVMTSVHYLKGRAAVGRLDPLRRLHRGSPGAGHAIPARAGRAPPG